MSVLSGSKRNEGAAMVKTAESFQIASLMFETLGRGH
jgi:hypothetical protein